MSSSSILGISAFYHDSAAALLIDGQIITAAAEERFTRLKHDPSFPKRAVNFVLDEAGLSVNDLSAIIFYEKPFVKFERLLETYHAFAPRGLKSFLAGIPVWMKEKLFMKRIIAEELEKLNGSSLSREIPILFSEHHLSHAASAFYPSPFYESAILTIDAVGEWATTTICLGKGNRIKKLVELDFPHSLGLLYSAFTYFCGFRVNSGEYKLMGLAPYGDEESKDFKKFYEIISNELVDCREDGSFLLNMNYFDYTTELRMVNEKKWEKLFGIKKRAMEDPIDQSYADIALAIQRFTEEIIFKLARTAREITNSSNLVLAGGVALNCVANGKLLKEKIFDQIWIQPAAGDAGGALGAAYAAHYLFMDNERERESIGDSMNGSYLGPSFSNKEILKVSRKYHLPYDCFENFDELITKVADLLAHGNVIGWFQDRMEWGPRALGNRSILADARNPEMQKQLNLKIKFREGFRPFAPIVLAEDCRDYFDLEVESPYMLLVANVNKKRLRQKPAYYKTTSLSDRLYFQRSDIPSVTHIDDSARIQTVKKADNEKLYKLLTAFKKITGYAVLINTSFNVRGEPIVCSPEDALRCFMTTEMDFCIINNYLFSKKTVPKELFPQFLKIINVD